MQPPVTVITLAGEVKLALRPGVDAMPLLEILRGAQLLRDHWIDDGRLIVEARQPKTVITIEQVREQDLVEDPNGLQPVPACWPPKERTT